MSSPRSYRLFSKFWSGFLLGPKTGKDPKLVFNRLSRKKYSSMASDEIGISPERIKQFRTQFYADPKNILALNICSKHDPLEVCLKRSTLEETNHVYTHKLETDGKPMTNQKSSGRCWIFACLNVIRLPFIKAHNLEEFEFSQAYLFFWDKIERSNFFLNSIVEVARRGETVDGRLMGFLLKDPISDGGQWDMVVNLINKYGLMPKKCYPESYSCEHSFRLNVILKSKLREFARDLLVSVEKGASEKEISNQIQGMMAQIFNVVGICVGVPPETFTWEYYAKNKVYSSVGPISPKSFYEELVKPHYKIDDKICLVTDPRPSNPYDRLYTVDVLGNMVNGRRTLYVNQPIEILMKLTAESIKGGEAVWMGCDIGKRFAGKQGFQDLECHDYKLVFGVDVHTSLSKAERLMYGESAMSHAMVFTAVSLDKETQLPVKWRVENSWGDDKADKGYLMMTSDWFREFMYEIVVDKKFVPAEILEVLKQEPVVLPAWDPMGTLANSS